MGVHPYPEPVKVREPVARPLDVVLAELLLSASQAFLAGVLLYLAVGIWDDRGVGFGPVAIILAMLGVVVGGSWLYWLLGGVGWPLAAANVPVAMFLGFAMVLGWQGDDLFRVEGVPLLLSLAASVYGIVCGVFLDSPRRWRWDQRQKLRPGTVVPRVSPATRAFVARVPRSVPRRSTASLQRADSLPPSPQAMGAAGGGTAVPYLDPDALPAVGDGSEEPLDGPRADLLEASGPLASSAGAPGTGAGDDAGADSDGPPMPTERLDRAARASGPLVDEAGPQDEPGAIELPTSLEPRAQRSPWAWAAPPEWNRDEDDEPPGSRSPGRR
jgi:hypothetical protein